MRQSEIKKTRVGQGSTAPLRLQLLTCLLSSRNSSSNLFRLLLFAAIIYSNFKTTEGQLGGSVVAIGAIENSTSRPIVTGVCEDLFPNCTLRGNNGECETDPANMLVNCPSTCDSCLPATEADCVDKSDPDSCFLGAVLGECQANPSYYLRFCSGSCSDFIAVCSLQTRDLGEICGDSSRSLSNPQFECGPEIDINSLREARWLKAAQLMNHRDLDRQHVATPASIDLRNRNARKTVRRNFKKKRHKEASSIAVDARESANDTQFQRNLKILRRKILQQNRSSKRKNIKKEKRRKKKPWHQKQGKPFPTFETDDSEKLNPTVTQVPGYTLSPEIYKQQEFETQSSLLFPQTKLKDPSNIHKKTKDKQRQDSDSSYPVTTTTNTQTLPSGTSTVTVGTTTTTRTVTGSVQTTLTNTSTSSISTATITSSSSFEVVTVCTEYISNIEAIYPSESFTMTTSESLVLLGSTIVTGGPSQASITTTITNSVIITQTVYTFCEYPKSEAQNCSINIGENGSCEVLPPESGYCILPCDVDCSKVIVTKELCDKGTGEDCPYNTIDIGKCDKTEEGECPQSVLEIEKCRDEGEDKCKNVIFGIGNRTESGTCPNPKIDWSDCLSTDDLSCSKMAVEPDDGEESELLFTDEFCFSISLENEDNDRCKPEITVKTNCLRIISSFLTCPTVIEGIDNCQIIYSKNMVSVIPVECPFETTTIPNTSTDTSPTTAKTTTSTTTDITTMTTEESTTPSVTTSTNPTEPTTEDPKPTTTESPTTTPTNSQTETTNIPTTIQTTSKTTITDLPPTEPTTTSITTPTPTDSPLSSTTNTPIPTTDIPAPPIPTEPPETSGITTIAPGDELISPEIIATLAVISTVISVILSQINAIALQQILQFLVGLAPNSDDDDGDTAADDADNDVDDGGDNDVDNDEDDADNDGDESEDNDDDNDQNEDQDNQDNADNSDQNDNNPESQDSSLDIPSTASLAAAAAALIPNCEPDGYLTLVQELQNLVGQNTGRPLSPDAFDIVESVNFCQHGGSGAVPAMAEAIALPEPGISPPPGWLGLSSPINTAVRSKRRTGAQQHFTHEAPIKSPQTTNQFKVPVIEYGGWIPITPPPYLPYSPLRKESKYKSTMEISKRQKRSSRGKSTSRKSKSHSKDSNTVLVIENALYSAPLPIEIPTLQINTSTANTTTNDTALQDVIPIEQLADPINVTEAQINLKNASQPIPFESSNVTLPDTNQTNDDPSKTLGTAAIGIVPSTVQEDVSVVRDEEDIDSTEDPDDIQELESELERNVFFCGGTLITQRHILTAAHCVIPKKPNLVRLGEQDFSQENESRAVDYRVERISINPGYKFPVKYNDIAIITLERNIPLQSGLVPSCVPPSELELDEGLVATVSGWGSRANEAASEILVDVEVKVRSLESCNSSYNTLGELFTLHYPNGLISSMLCAGGDEGEDVCRGDSGGPLLLRDNLQVAGVVSAGFGCGDINFPGLYTRVDNFLAWMDLAVFGKCASPIR